MTTNRQNPYLQVELEDKAVVLKPGEGEMLATRGSRITLKVTSEISNDQLGIYEIELEPHTVGAQLHFHRFMDETFLVNKGTLTVKHGSSEVETEPGSIIYIPRFTPHDFANNTDQPVVTTLIFNPGQKREGFIRGLIGILEKDPIDPEDYLTLYHKYDSHPVDPGNFLPR
jgi:quercetin dioxygenase-like cupin family protein